MHRAWGRAAQGSPGSARQRKIGGAHNRREGGRATPAGSGDSAHTASKPKSKLNTTMPWRSPRGMKIRIVRLVQNVTIIGVNTYYRSQVLRSF